MIQIDVQAVHPEFINVFKTQTQGAAGFDMCAYFPGCTKDEPGFGLKIDPGKWERIPLGCRMAIPSGWYIKVVPRSGLALKHGITLVNSPGIIDSDYRGEISAVVINHGNKPFIVLHGMRICQILIQKNNTAEFTLVEKLSETERGTGGFGSTGTL